MNNSNKQTQFFIKKIVSPVPLALKDISEPGDRTICMVLEHLIDINILGDCLWPSILRVASLILKDVIHEEYDEEKQREGKSRQCRTDTSLDKHENSQSR